MLVEDQRRAVEHELVLAADEIRVHDRLREFGGASREHRLTLAQPLRVIRRGIQVDQQVRTRGRLRAHRAVGSPRVLTDRHADAHAGDFEQLARIRAGREVALLVEHRVVRKVLLAIDTLHPAHGAHGGRVVEIAGPLRKPDDRSALVGPRRNLLECLRRTGDEGRAQEEILRRIPGNRQLREHDQVGPGRRRGVVRIEDAACIRLEITDDRVDLSGGNTDARHTPRI